VGTLAAVAAGLSDTLIDRAADVTLKEAARGAETPFSALHLENMLKLARWGVISLPIPASTTPAEAVEVWSTSCGANTDHLEVKHDEPWGEERS